MDLEQLIRAATDGDKRAWTRLASLVTPNLRGFFARRCVGFDCLDLIQDTLIVVWRKLPDFEVRSEAAFMTWVYTIAQFVALAALRQSGQTAKMTAALEHVQRTPSRKVSSLLDRAGRLAEVLREVDNLPPSYRRAIQNMLDGGDARDLAEQVGITWGSARSSESRAVAKLRERLMPGTPDS